MLLEIKCALLQCDITEMKQVGFETWFRNPPTRTETREKAPEKLHFKLGMDLSRGQKQGRDEVTQEHYPTTE